MLKIISNCEHSAISSVEPIAVVSNECHQVLSREHHWSTKPKSIKKPRPATTAERGGYDFFNLLLKHVALSPDFSSICQCPLHARWLF